MTAVTVPAKVARNLTRSFFEMAHKRCNSNGRISKSEICGGELRATLMRSRWGLAGQRADVPNHTPAHQAPLVWRRRRAWRPGCGARGWRRGLAGLRADAPSEARGADGSRARQQGGPKRHGSGTPSSPVRLGRQLTARNADTANSKGARAPRLGHTEQSGPRAGSDGARNTRGATSKIRNTRGTR